MSCWVPRPRWWRKGGTIRVNRSLKVYCILFNAEITCSPDQKTVQESVSVTDDYNNYYYWICSWLVVLTVVFRFQIQAISAYCLLICIPLGISDGFSSLILKIIFDIYSNYYLYNNYLLFVSHLLNLIPAGATIFYYRNRPVTTGDRLLLLMKTVAI